MDHWKKGQGWSLQQLCFSVSPITQMVVGVTDGQLIKSCVILRTDEYMDGLLKEGSRLDSFCLDSHLWLQFLWCACCDVPWSRMFGIDGEEKRKCERNEEKNSSMCVLCPVYTIYTYTHVHCICTAGGHHRFPNWKVQAAVPPFTEFWHNTIRLAFVMLIIPSPKRRSYVVAMNLRRSPR